MIMISVLVCPCVIRLQIAFWMITSERQSGRLRHDFFRAVLCKHVAWFDFRTPGELTTRLAGKNL
jgi:ABC-type bacteriocin/lantibiotic exporter with double-glycine peptidase domain